jgi:uncharacterized OB-fold protein
VVLYLHCQLTAESSVPSRMACMGCISSINALFSSSACTNVDLFCFILCLEEDEEATAEEEEAVAAVVVAVVVIAERGLNTIPSASASRIKPFEKVDVALSLNIISRLIDRMSGVIN